MKARLIISGILSVIAVVIISNVNAQDVSVKSQEAITASSSLSDQAVDLNCGSKKCTGDQKSECVKEKSCDKEKECDKAKSCDKEKKSCDGEKKSCGRAK